MRSRIIYLITLVVITVCVLTTVYHLPELFPLPKSGLPEHFNALSRQEQVMVCASCHPTQYENEMAGPHANAYSKLMEHVQHVNGPDYHLPFYADFVNMVQGQTCISCHATDNLYEHYFKAEHTVDNLINLYNDGVTRLPQVRTDPKSHFTGVDCLTCHYDGSNVVTNGPFTPNKNLTDGQSCLPVGSAIFQSDFNCMPCHAPNMTEDHTFYYPGTEAGATCVSCHQEYDAKGKGTHYYYWRFDPDNKVRGSKLTGFYEPHRVERSGEMVLVHWNNRNLPHRISDCPELVLSFTVKDSLGKVYGTGELRINRKTDHDRVMEGAGVFKGHELPGTVGCSPKLNGVDTVIPIVLKNPPARSRLQLEVTALSKPHYWEGDSIGVIKFNRRLPID